MKDSQKLNVNFDMTLKFLGTKYRFIFPIILEYDDKTTIGDWERLVSLVKVEGVLDLKYSLPTTSFSNCSIEVKDHKTTKETCIETLMVNDINVSKDMTISMDLTLKNNLENENNINYNVVIVTQLQDLQKKSDKDINVNPNPEGFNLGIPITLDVRGRPDISNLPYTLKAGKRIYDASGLRYNEGGSSKDLKDDEELKAGIALNLKGKPSHIKLGEGSSNDFKDDDEQHEENLLFMGLKVLNVINVLSCMAISTLIYFEYKYWANGSNVSACQALISGLGTKITNIPNFVSNCNDFLLR